jgi:hypothetical protein
MTASWFLLLRDDGLLVLVAGGGGAAGRGSSIFHFALAKPLPGIPDSTQMETL